MKEQSQLIQQVSGFEKLSDHKINTINPPIYQGSTILFDSYKELALANKGEYKGMCYGTQGLPPQRLLEDALCQLEHGAICKTFQSGISAITHALLAFCKTGDHIIICDNVYWPTSNFCNKILTKFGIEISYVPSAVGAEIIDFINERTKVIFMESPGSNTFEIQDIEPICKIAKNKGIVTMLDGTWATPLYFKALDWGVDVSIQSITKYISGHSDILMGSVTVNEKYAETFDDYYNTVELFSPPQDCYMSLRGLKTLSVRLKHHENAAMKIATWLETQDEVDTIIHPAFANHPQHERWKKYFTGSSGLFSFTFKNEPSDEKLTAFIDSLKIFGIGYSWGGYKSLVTAGKYSRVNGSPYADKYVIRISIGFEDINDIKEDLSQALALLN
ncbi:MAG: cystathionine beta-lyase [Desulfotalea sp.]